MLCVIGAFIPPAGMSPTKFELNNVELFDDKDDIKRVDDEQYELQRRLSLPKPVQELMDAEDSSNKCIKVVLILDHVLRFGSAG